MKEETKGMTTDPTPRAAATARDALADALHKADTTCGFLIGYHLPVHEDEADAILAALPDGWTLAAAEPPGRVAALEAALERIRGLTDGMTVDEMSERYGSEHRVLFVIIPDIVDKALAAPASPADVSAEVKPHEHQWVRFCPTGDRRWGCFAPDRCDEVMPESFDPVPAPIPSEPVGRCVFRAFVSECGRTRAEHIEAAGVLHPFTPATRDE